MAFNSRIVAIFLSSTFHGGRYPVFFSIFSDAVLAARVSRALASRFLASSSAEVTATELFHPLYPSMAPFLVKVMDRLP